MEKNKRVIIQLLKSMLVITTINLFIIILLPSSSAFIFSIICVSIFTVLTVIYYAYFADENDGKILISLWKVYFSTIFILVTVLFSTFGYIIDKTNDLQKTKINYYLEIDEKEKAKEHFEVYVKSNNALFNLFSPIKITDLVQKGLSENTSDKGNNDIFWYVNFLLFLINLMTIVMFLICLVELSKFKCVKEL